MLDGDNVQATCDIITHWVWEMDHIDNNICVLFMQCIDKANWEQALDPLYKLMDKLLALKDSLQTLRVARYLNGINGVIYKARHYQRSDPLFSYHTIKYLMTVCFALSLSCVSSASSSSHHISVCGFGDDR
jgi:hypothetical protein